MGRTACTEPQCLYKVTLYLYLSHSQYVSLIINKSEKLVLCTVVDEIFRAFFSGLLTLFVARASIYGLKNGLDCN
jgi:hypothetical protein